MSGSAQERIYVTEAEELPKAFVVPEMASDQWTRRRCQKFIGSIAVVNEVLDSSESYRTANLMEALHKAETGDPEAIKLVAANIRTDLIERRYKAGVVVESELEEDGDGSLRQFGQSMRDVYGNTLSYTVPGSEAAQRAPIEALNGHRIEDLRLQGYLEDHYFVVFSTCPEGMTDEELDKNNYFSATKTAALQLTYEINGSPKVESAFVAGVAEPGADRHDLQALREVAAHFSIDYSDLDPRQILNRPMLIPKSLLPNGLLDIVKMYDQAAGGTFFGQAKPVQNYEEYKIFCQKRERELEPLVRKIMSEMLAGPRVKTPLEAVKLLDELSRRYTFDAALTDNSIDRQIFGPASAAYLEEYDRLAQQGNHEAAQDVLAKARQADASFSCPAAWLKSEADMAEGSEAKTSATESTAGKIRCIKCREEVQKKEVVKQDCWECPKCKHKVDICNGAILREGVVDKTESDSAATLIADLLSRLARPASEKAAA